MQSSRWLALDSARGLAVLGMILVVSPGSWVHRFKELDHALWNGWTAADLVMPLFLFCVGLALGLKIFRSTDSKLDLSKILIRTFLLITIGLVLSWIDSGNLKTIRIPGILQRIAVCYLLASIILHIFCKKNSYGMSIFAFLIVICLTNYILMNGFAIAAAESGELTFKDNLAALIDRWIFGVQHLWIWGKDTNGDVVYDPEGLLSTIFATSNVLAGALIFLLREKIKASGSSKTKQLLTIIAITCFAVAYVLDHYGVLINKKLWSLSFTLLSIGLCIVVIVMLDLIHTNTIVSRALFGPQPLIVFGSNAILAFVISTLLLIYAATPMLKLESELVGPQAYTYHKVNSVITEPHLASLACALLVSVAIYLLLLPLYRKRIFLRL